MAYGLRFSKSAIMFCLVASYASSTFAAFGNYNSILIGDMAAGMGGAATAVSEDAAGAAWYNPASLAALKGESFSAAVGIYKKFATQYGIGDDLISSALKVNQGFFRALPSSTGSVIRPKQIEWLKDWTMTLSILVPEFDQYRGQVATSPDNNSTLAMTDESLWAGGAIARQISPTEYFGVTAYYTARSLQKSVNDRTYRGPNDFKIYTEDLNITQNSLVFIAGYLKELGAHWSWGVSIRFPNIHMVGRASYLANTFEAGQAERPVVLSELDSKSRIPARLNLGASYRDNAGWIVAADLNIHGYEQYEDIQTTQPGIAERLEHRPLINLSIGAEYKFTNWFKIRMGGFTNFSSLAKPDPAISRGQGDQVNQMGFAANAAFRSGHIEYTFGGYYSGGRGEGVQRVNHQYVVLPKSQNIYTMLVGTSYYF
jgi:hypothetical protein